MGTPFKNWVLEESDSFDGTDGRFSVNRSEVMPAKHGSLSRFSERNLREEW
jgi:hypothetical protein